MEFMVRGGRLYRNGYRGTRRMGERSRIPRSFSFVTERVFVGDTLRCLSKKGRSCLLFYEPP